MPLSCKPTPLVTGLFFRAFDPRRFPARLSCGRRVWTDDLNSPPSAVPSWTAFCESFPFPLFFESLSDLFDIDAIELHGAVR